MRDYYNIFVELSLQQCNKSDYMDKLKVKKHNIASTKLHQIKMEMKSFDCTEILRMLLCHEDCRVKINAAALCLEKNILQKQAVIVLKDIINYTDDSSIRFSAQMVLQNISKSKI